MAEGKQSYPGRKQVFRVYDANGKMQEDILGLEEEILGDPLLKNIVKDGKQVYKFPDLNGVKKVIQTELGRLPGQYKKIRNPDKYSVKISEKLQEMFEEVKKYHG